MNSRNRMKKTCDASRTSLGLATFLLLTGAATAWAAEPESLEDVLVRKGVLTPQEADQVQKKEKAEERAIKMAPSLTAPAGRLKPMATPSLATSSYRFAIGSWPHSHATIILTRIRTV